MSKKLGDYLSRFTLVHVITYVVIGFLMMTIQNYQEVMETMETFKLYRTLEDPLLAALLIPTQIIRGAFLAIFLYPFRKMFIKKQRGWLLLFAVLYGFTFLESIFPGLINNFVETMTKGISLKELLFGTLEVTVQMFIFSWLFIKWEKRTVKTK